MNLLVETAEAGGLPASYISPLITLIVATVLLLVLILELVWMYTRRVRYVWNFRGKDIVAELKSGRARLLSGGRLADEFSGARARVCILRTSVEGAEVLVRVTFGLRLKAEATAAGAPLTPISVGK